MHMLISIFILVIIIPAVSFAAAVTISRPNKHKNMPRSSVMLGIAVLTIIIAVMFYLFIFFVKR